MSTAAATATDKESEIARLKALIAQQQTEISDLRSRIPTTKAPVTAPAAAVDTKSVPAVTPITSATASAAPVPAAAAAVAVASAKVDTSKPVSLSAHESTPASGDGAIKYVTPGRITYGGVLESSDRSIVDSLWHHPVMVKSIATCAAAADAAGDDRKVYWINMYLRPKWMDGMSAAESDAAWRLAERLVDRCGLYDSKTCFILNVGFLVNPAGTRTAQPWHIDYSYSNATIFVPITRVDDQNMTQFLDTERLRDDDLDDGWTFPGGITRALEYNPYARVVQVIAPPYSVVHMPPITIHRGIPNRGTYDRVMFFVTYDKLPILVHESAVTDGKDSGTNWDQLDGQTTTAPSNSAATAAAAATTATPLPTETKQ